jgi:hypothetical protein
MDSANFFSANSLLPSALSASAIVESVLRDEGSLINCWSAGRGDREIIRRLLVLQKLRATHGPCRVRASLPHQGTFTQVSRVISVHYVPP